MPRFVIQQHAATSMHWDFRLEVDGTFKSWAVPKGPSTDPRDKRLAMEVDDHSLSWGDFEGVIPGWSIRRTRGRQWLLVKRRDETADARRRPTSTQPESVVSGRTIEEVREEGRNG
jgi:DNA polymerase Ligase (LigD)